LLNNLLKVAVRRVIFRLARYQSRWLMVLFVETVIAVAKGATSAARPLGPLNVLIEPALGGGVNQMDARLVDFRQRYARLARLHLGCQEFVKLME
jgi:hypothetical protein